MAYLRSSDTIKDEIMNKIGILVTTFDGLIQNINPNNPSVHQGRIDATALMDRGFQQDYQTRTLIKTTQDLLGIINYLQQLWVFGKLMDPIEQDAGGRAQQNPLFYKLAEEVIEKGSKELLDLTIGLDQKKSKGKAKARESLP